MTKPACRTVSYVVYSPGYVPGVGIYERAKTFVAAYKLCRKLRFGPGSEVIRQYFTRNDHGSSSWGDTREFVYTGETK